MSFGVFRGDVEDVVLRVSASAPPEAVFWQFHPDQQIELVDGGGFRVRFRASGMRELAWHLFSWSTHVTVESPDRLRGTLRDEVHRLARHLDGDGPEARP
jgi:predicted DNA-binding transcriptional regulator YafY